MEKRFLYKIIALFLIFSLTLMVLACSNDVDLPENEPEPNVYIALGDSVSSGYGLDGYLVTIPQGRHSVLFFEKLQNQGFVEHYMNLAVSGFTTTTLLNQLHGLDDDTLEFFRDARVITLNVGGNNILTPFLDYLDEMQINLGADSFMAGIDGILSGSLSDLGGILSGFGDLLFGVGDVIAGTPSAFAMLLGNISEELEAVLDLGVQTFGYEFEEIILWLEANAPRADIIVNTIYNPIPLNLMGISVELANVAAGFIERMNEVIRMKSEAGVFFMVDLDAYLTNRLDLTAFNLNPIAGDVSVDLIHPNLEGHSLIARLHYEAFREILERE